MHPEHRALLEALKRSARAVPAGYADPKGYVGSAQALLDVAAPEQRAIAKAWVAAHKTAAADEVLALAGSLFQGGVHEEKTLGAILIGCHRGARLATRPQDIDRWLDHLAGWAQVDSLCQNLFKAEQMLADWPAWKGLIERLAGDPNINKRRAALVLLTGPVNHSDDPRFAPLAFATIERLKGEKPILITKAVSWLLRSMTKRHAAEVAAYLDAQSATLPAIAVRETRTKLATGRKG